MWWRGVYIWVSHASLPKRAEFYRAPQFWGLTRIYAYTRGVRVEPFSYPTRTRTRWCLPIPVPDPCRKLLSDPTRGYRSKALPLHYRRWPIRAIYLYRNIYNSGVERFTISEVKLCFWTIFCSYIRTRTISAFEQHFKAVTVYCKPFPDTHTSIIRFNTARSTGIVSTLLGDMQKSFL